MATLRPTVRASTSAPMTALAASSNIPFSVPTVCRCGGKGRGVYLLFLFTGTIFNQQYFICDWWFNVDCSLVILHSYHTEPLTSVLSLLQTEEYYFLNEEVAAAAAAATAAENLLNGQQINFPSRPGAQQGSGVIPGQTFSGIQPRLGKNKDLSGEEGRASFGNNIEDDLSLAVENFPQDSIPVQFLGEIGIS